MSGQPRLGETISLEIGNSLGATTASALFLGFSDADLPGAWGGSLLLVPSLVIPLGLPPLGLSLPIAIPSESVFCGLNLFMQVLQSDVGAPAGVSATPGLDARLGQ